MAIVETFWVKPTGFLASKRYANINVTDDGLVYVTDVFGKESINLDFVSDYRTNNRVYANDQLITSFCNLTTFTRYNVFAQDERPFAYVTTDLDDPTCGFETPLPEPAVPPNPFGTPSYGEYRFMNYCDDNGVNINISIEKKNYEGSSSEIIVGDKQTVKLSYKEVESKFTPIRPLECTLGFINNENFLLKEFYTEDERTFRVTITKGGEIQFKGYIIPDSCSEPFSTPPYPVYIKCTDALGSLKTVTYPFPAGGTFDMRQSFVDVIAYCLAPLNLNLDIVTICNLYEVSMPNSLDNDPLSLVTFNPLRLADDTGKTLTSYDVLVEVAKAWGAYFVQSKGKWHFVRANEPSKLVIRQRTYNYKGFFLIAENVENNRIASKQIGATDLIPLSGANIEIQNAYKRVVVFSAFGKVPSILYNGDFEAWNGFNFTFWTKYGGIDISRIQRSVVNSQGAITYIQNYALQFNKRANPAKWLEHSDIPVQQGDTIKMSYRVGKTLTGTTSRPSRIVYFKMRIKVGEYYLYNADAGNTYTWVKSLAIVINQIENPFGDLNTFTFGFQIPEAPVTGAMVIQLFGFTDSLIDEDVEKSITPILIDDFTATKTSQSGENDIIGILNITDNSRYFTQKPDKIDTLFADYFFRPLALQQLDNLYAMYIGTDYTTGWVEYGISTQPVAFGLALSKAIMRAYQQPFMFWTGGFNIVEEARQFSYLDVINFNVPNEPAFNNKRFAFLGGDIDLKENIISSVKLAEIFDASGVTIDNSVPFYPNMPEPIFIQDANYVKPEGVFTIEFTEQFN